MENNQNVSQKKQVFWVTILIVFLVCGIFLRSYSLSSRSLEYDEIWTLQKYAKENILTIFTDLSLPNNHPLHTLAVSRSIQIFGESEFSIRFPAFLAGCVLLLSIPFSLFAAKKSFTTILLATAWIAFSPPLIHYSQTARGYSLQILLIFLHALCLWESFHKKSLNLYWSMVVLGILSVLTIPTSFLYIFPATFYAIIGLSLSWKKTVFLKKFLWENKGILLSHAVLIILISLWLFFNLSQFQAGQIYGTFEWNTFFLDGFSIFKALFPLPLMPFFLLSFIKAETRKNALFFLSLCLFVFFTAPLVKWGPSRVYLYLVVFYFLSCAEGGKYLFNIPFRYRFLVYSLGIILCIFPFYNIIEKIENFRSCKDWKNILPQLEKIYPKNVYCIYPIHETYTIQYYFFPEINVSLLERIPVGDTHFLAVFKEKNIFSAERKNDEVVIIDTSSILSHRQTEMDIQADIFALKKIDAKDRILDSYILPGIWILAIGPCSEHPKVIGDAIENLDYSWCFLNLFLSHAIQNKEGSWISGEVLVAQNPPSQPIRKILSNPIFRLYRVESLKHFKLHQAKF